jgi:hypothetical protein
VGIPAGLEPATRGVVYNGVIERDTFREFCPRSRGSKCHANLKFDNTFWAVAPEVAVRALSLAGPEQIAIKFHGFSTGLRCMFA